MKTLFLIVFLSISITASSHALIINEIMSNPVGDDGGREWIEIYNNSSSTVDITNLSISIKGGPTVSVIPLSGGTVIPANGYGIIGSTVSGVTKFLTDYPAYSGPLLRSSISLVNTGTTSIEIKMNGVSQDSITSYTAAKEGFTLSRTTNGFVSANPTPGAENQAATDTSTQETTTSVATTTNTQAQLISAQIPASDIVLYLPGEKTVIAGAEALFPAFSLTRAGKSIENLVYSWAYGDGGQGTGSTTMYRYAYPGRYMITVEAGNGYVMGTGRMMVRVVAPDISIKAISTGKYGAYVDIENPNNYELDFSQWRLTIDGATFLFPKNTILIGNTTTRISGVAMGFASTTLTSNTLVKILFPNLEEVTRYQAIKEQIIVPDHPFQSAATSTVVTEEYKQANTIYRKQPVNKNLIKVKSVGSVLGTSTSHVTASGSKVNVSAARKENQRDTRIATFFRSFFSKESKE